MVPPNGSPPEDDNSATYFDAARDAFRHAGFEQDPADVNEFLEVLFKQDVAPGAMRILNDLGYDDLNWKILLRTIRDADDKPVFVAAYGSTREKRADYLRMAANALVRGQPVLASDFGGFGRGGSNGFLLMSELSPRRIISFVVMLLVLYSILFSLHRQPVTVDDIVTLLEAGSRFFEKLTEFVNSLPPR